MAGRSTPEELAGIEDPAHRKTARQTIIANLAGSPPTDNAQRLYPQCRIEFGVMRIGNKGFVIGSWCEPGEWFPVDQKVAFRPVAENGPDTLTEFRDMAEIRRINGKIVRNSLAFAGPSEQLVRSLAGSR